MSQKKQNDTTRPSLYRTVGMMVAVSMLLVSILAIFLLGREAKTEKNLSLKPISTPGGTDQSLQISPSEEEPPSVDPNTGEVIDPSVNSTTTQPTESTEGNTAPTIPYEEIPLPTVGEGEAYELRLAAAMVVAVSMMYPDFEFQGIYIASETPLEDHSRSAGAYVLFASEGQSLALYSRPLAEERKESGSADLYVPTLGYSTYELVDPQSVPVASLTELALEELEEAILQSTQTTVIER
ncbi:MAG: hypothetical protein IKT58_03435 [Oscillospiraceae bacterium]|nr:hypothetical protein [Oscillospiraceae bacterium]